VLLNNYQAVWKGLRRIVNIVSKSGTEDFHAPLYYARNEKLNATTSSRTRRAMSAALPVQHRGGTSAAAPAAGLARRDNQKLFFFLQYEYRPPPIRRIRVLHGADGAEAAATSRTRWECQGRPLPGLQHHRSLDRTAFPNGIIPADRIDPNMQKLLNVFPCPTRRT